MDEHDYVYQLRPLIVPGLMFLIIYPVVMGIVHFFGKLPSMELRVLIGIYAIAGLGILAIWIIGKSKHVQIEDQRIVFHSLLGKQIIEPKDIRRVVFYFDGRGQEVAQIRANNEFYYVSELYFPFPELMSDLESFVQKYDLRSNFKSYTGLNK